MMWKLNPWKWKDGKTAGGTSMEIQEELNQPSRLPQTTGEFLVRVMRHRPDIREKVAGLKDKDTFTITHAPFHQITVSAKAARVALAAALLEDPE